MAILDEQRLTVTQAARRLDMPIRTVWRWILRGIPSRGVQLESFLIGGKRFTTVEAIERFVAACNTTAATPSPSPTNRQRQRALDQAERELQEAGI